MESLIGTARFASINYLSAHDLKNLVELDCFGRWSRQIAGQFRFVSSLCGQTAATYEDFHCNSCASVYPVNATLKSSDAANDELQPGFPAALISVLYSSRRPSELVSGFPGMGATPTSTNYQ
jgi:hypothetical protein